LVPVLVWIHGGGFEKGCSKEEIYYGDFIANSSATILVSFDYRLGSLGFLASEHIQGNFGIMDQQLALGWIHDNIQSFGGDPNQVTIFGQSAGAISVGVHMTSPISVGKNWFQKAIMQSNILSLAFRTVQEQHNWAGLFAEFVDCHNASNMDCLRSVPVEKILAVQDESIVIPLNIIEALKSMPWEPTIDNKLITGLPLDMLHSGQFLHVPVIIGTVRNETCSFEFNTITFSLPEFLYSSFIDISFREKASLVLEKYPATSDSRYPLEHLTVDYLFHCSGRYAADGIAKAGVPVYFYVFLHSPLLDPSNNSSSCKGQVCHGAEIPYIFHSNPFRNAPQTSDEVILTQQVMNYWIAFAHDKPLISDGVQWPQYTSNNQQAMAFDIPLHIENGYHSDLCDFWDKIGY